MTRTRRTVLAGVVLLVGCQRGAVAPAPAPPSGPASVTGWQIRYTAALALAHRGSPEVKDAAPWQAFHEMLDEEQQLRNFRTTLDKGQEYTDRVAAAELVKAAMRALVHLHEQAAEIDLSAFKPRIEKVAESPDLALRTEAKQALLALGK